LHHQPEYPRECRGRFRDDIEAIFVQQGGAPLRLILGNVIELGNRRRDRDGHGGELREHAALFPAYADQLSSW